MLALRFTTPAIALSNKLEHACWSSAGVLSYCLFFVGFFCEKFYAVPSYISSHAGYQIGLRMLLFWSRR